MAAAGVCWFAGSSVSAAVFLHRGPLVHLLVSYPTGRLRRKVAVGLTALAYLVAAVAALDRNSWVVAAFAVLVLVGAADVFSSTSGPARKAGGLSLASALVFTAALAFSSLERLRGWDVDLAVLLVYDAAVLVVALTLLAGLLWGRWTDAALADLVTGLGGQRDTHGLGGALRAALGDPSLVVGYWTPDQARYVDDQGSRIDLPGPSDGRTVTHINEEELPLAVLVHDRVLLDDPQMLTGVASAARLAVANARMRAAVQLRVTELDASRRRLVEAGDVQRRELRLALAQGAEQRLVEVERLLVTCCGDQAYLLGVLAELREARIELDEFAQGIRPAALTSGGLAAAVPILAARATIPVTTTVAVGRLAPPVEGAVFFFCSEALANIGKHAHATAATVDVHLERGSIVATVVDDGAGGADVKGSGLRGLADRVESLGGTLLVESAVGGGSRITASIPARTPAQEVR